MESIQNYIKKLNEWFTSNQLVDGENLFWERTPFGIVPHIEIPETVESNGDTYNGPFQVIKDDDTADNVLTIKAYDGVDYFAHNYIIPGIEARIEQTDDDLIITTTGSLYIHVYYSGGYQYEFLNDFLLPAQTDGHYYETIAEVDLTDGVASRNVQVCRHEIHVKGRIV